MSVITQIADAVVTSLNGGSFSQSFTAQRRYQPSFALAEMETLRVTVVPKSVSITNATRDSGFFDCAIDIGVQKKVNPEDQAEADALLGLVDELMTHLRGRRLDDAPEAAWLSLTHDPIFAAEHLDSKHVLTSVLTVTYRVQR
ncbi:MAG TPA: hypothetical protein PLV57_20550 [Phycisphaerae bacterium]|nr:hypothetical protein [Phycisphaerae bacterium]HPP28905.1 hypothetical protein [Phycisphaerae bacterium]